MTGSRSVSRIQDLQLQLDEALQMIRLAANNKRTCLELQEWLDRNHPLEKKEFDVIQTLISKKDIE